MEATEARSISEQKQIKFVDCVEIIKAAAEEGNTQTSFLNARPSAITELMKCGYKVSIHTDMYNGMESHLISW